MTVSSGRTVTAGELIASPAVRRIATDAGRASARARASIPSPRDHQIGNLLQRHLCRRGDRPSSVGHRVADFHVDPRQSARSSASVTAPADTPSEARQATIPSGRTSTAPAVVIP
jgi:hypothetical protein